MAPAKLFAIAAIAVVTGCSSFEATAPDGFATYNGSRPYRAVSSDGVVYRVRTENDASDATMSFWREALKKRMTDAGYSFLRDGDIKAANVGDGYLLEVTAPFGLKDYTYLMAVFKSGKHLVLVESSGEITTFEKHRPAVLAAVEKLRID
jgi:hypothetical protein